MGDHQERKCAFEPRVIFVMESVEEKMKLKSSFKNKISLAVGVVHIFSAILTVITYLYGESVLVHTPIFAGIWTSLFFVTSGIITIAGSQSGVKGLVVATLVSSVLSAISATILFLIAFALVKRHINPWRPQDIYLIEMVMGGLMFIFSIASSIIALRSICTDSTSPHHTVHISQLQQIPRTDGCRHLQTFPDSCRRLQPPRDCAFVSLQQQQQQRPLPTAAFEPPPPYPCIPPPMYLL